MRIGINALCMSDKMAGVSTVIHAFINEIKTENKHQFELFIPCKVKNLFAELPPHITVHTVRVPSVGARVFMEQCVLPFFVLIGKLDRIFSMGNVGILLCGGKNVVVVYDVYFMHMRARFSFLKYIYLRSMVSLTALIASEIVCISNETKSDLARFSPSTSKKTTVAYLGFEGKQIQVETNACWLNENGIYLPYYLFVGTIEPGKNLASLVKAIFEIEAECQLVVVGKRGWGYAELDILIGHHPKGNRILFLGFVEDSVLSLLYAGALATVLPSFHEGFGLPIIEAMSFGCPVCCSNTSCLPEIAADAAIYFDPHDIAQIKASLERVRDNFLRESLRTKGFANIQRFSWKGFAQKCLEVIEK